MLQSNVLLGGKACPRPTEPWRPDPTHSGILKARGMSDVFSAEEAQEQWLEILGRVARGGRITITKNGRPVAMLVPPEAQAPRDVREVIAEFPAFSAGRSLGGLSIRELIEQGRRS